jgi:hypothetical protein
MVQNEDNGRQEGGRPGWIDAIIAVVTWILTWLTLGWGFATSFPGVTLVIIVSLALFGVRRHLSGRFKPKDQRQ